MREALARASRRRRGSRRRRRTGRGRSAAARRSRRRHRSRRGASRATPRRGPRRPRGRPAPSAGDGRPRSVGRGRRPCPTGGRASTGDATRGGTDRTPSSGPNSSTAASTSRPNRTTPRLKLEAATADAPYSPRSASTVGRSAVQPVVAMTNRRQPASSAAARLAITASARDASTTSPAPARSAGSCRSPRGRPRTRTARRRRRRPSVRSSAAASTARPSGPSPRMSIVSMSWSLHRLGEGAAGSEVRARKSRGHRRGAAAPGASVPWRPRFVVSDAPSRAPGPVPPGRAARASSWTRPRRCGGSCSNCYTSRAG